MSRQYWEETLAWATADGTAVANTAAETIIFPNITIPANFMQDGRCLKLSLMGRWGATATPTLTIRVRWGGVGGTVLTATGATVMSAQTAAQWNTDVIIQTRVNGATGSLYAMGKTIFGTATVPTAGTATNLGFASMMGSAGIATPAAVTVDLTADTALSVSAQWSAASASNTIQGHIYTVEALN